ncbi:D-glycero-alpha-D-manno-heptose 7-phosphate kinase [compost metagenome]
MNTPQEPEWLAFTEAQPEAPGDGRAFGKLILAGEHAVVYGHPAIAAPLPALSALAWVVPGEEGVRITSEGYSEAATLETRQGPLAPLAEAARDALARMGIDPVALPPLHIQLASTIPAGSGLGSSAAVTVALVRALYQFFGFPLDPTILQEIATEAECIVHGTSSGVDPAAVSATGPIRFRKGEAPHPIPLTTSLHLVVADSGERCATAPMVRKVREAIERDPEAQKTLDALGVIAPRMESALVASDLAAVGTLMNEAHAGLARLGLSTPKLDAMAQAARNAGAWGAKLSGSGGGGVIVALTPREKAGAVAQQMQEAGATAVTYTRIP